MEAECLKMLVSHYKAWDYDIMSTWRVKRAGGRFARFQGGNDFMDSYDVGLVVHHKSEEKDNNLVLVQVKSRFVARDMEKLVRISGAFLYFAVYGKTRKMPIFKLGRFSFFKVE